MKRTIQYPITDFYIGELYLYTKFGNLLMGESIEESERRVQSFSQSGAINFQPDLISRYTDWENKREYTGFLTVFYKQNNKYLCLHDGKIYQLNHPIIIDNLVPLRDLLPKIDAKSIPRISMYEALELFDILFKEDVIDEKLYNGNKQKISDFIVGDIILREKTPIESADARYQYFNLPYHIMLEKSNLAVHSFSGSNYTNIVYRCLFLKDGVDLYNINNFQYYNPNEDSFERIITFDRYMEDFDLSIQSDKMTIPKALRLFKKTTN